MTELKVNREFKDRMFKWLFERNRKQLLDLYNALNNSSYTDENELYVNTLEDVIYVRMKNDLSFILSGQLVLLEQQSSYNPNMPIREFMYGGRLYSKTIEERKLNIYGSKLVKLPAPQCYVFYNGMRETSDIEILRLSDAFEVEAEGYEWTVTMVNINRGHNRKLMEHCEFLRAYADFMSTVRELAETNILGEAVSQTVDIFIRRGGEFGELLAKHRAEVTDMCLTEFNEEVFIDGIKQEGREEGLKSGVAMVSTLAQKLMAENRLDDLKRSFVDEEYQQQLLKEYGLIR